MALDFPIKFTDQDKDSNIQNDIYNNADKENSSSKVRYSLQKPRMSKSFSTNIANYIREIYNVNTERDSTYDFLESTISTTPDPTYTTMILDDAHWTCKTSYFGVDPSVQIYTHNTWANPIFVNFNSTGDPFDSFCLECDSECNGCTTCNGCYNQIVTCENCASSCTSSCTTGCTTGCTEGCVEIVGCGSDVGEGGCQVGLVEYIPEDSCVEGCTSCDGCTASVVSECLNDTAEVCDNCQGACQGGCADACQTCTSEVQACSASSYTFCGTCNDCTSCTSCNGGVDSQSCKSVTSCTGCTEGCTTGTTSAVEACPECVSSCQGACQNGQNGISTTGVCHDSVSCIGGEVSCTLLTALFGGGTTYKCKTTGVTVTCNNNNAKPYNERCDGPYVGYTETSCGTDDVTIYTCASDLYSRYGKLRVVACSGNCNSVEFSESFKNNEPTDPTTDECSSCDSSCDNSCQGCDGSCTNCDGCTGNCQGCTHGCTSGCTTGCTSGCTSSCVDGCTGSCASSGQTCSNCTNGCTTACNAGCTGCANNTSCTGCTEACAAGCTSSCASGCTNACVDHDPSCTSCVSSCTVGCQASGTGCTGCTTGCTSCDGSCTTSCQTAGTGCGACAGSCTSGTG